MNKNQETCNRLNEMELSERAESLISQTDFNIMSELFGHCETAEDVEEMAEEILRED